MEPIPTKIHSRIITTNNIQFGKKIQYLHQKTTTKAADTKQKYNIINPLQTKLKSITILSGLIEKSKLIQEDSQSVKSKLDLAYQMANNKKSEILSFFETGSFDSYKDFTSETGHNIHFEDDGYDILLTESTQEGKIINQSTFNKETLEITSMKQLLNDDNEYSEANFVSNRTHLKVLCKKEDGIENVSMEGFFTNKQLKHANIGVKNSLSGNTKVCEKRYDYNGSILTRFERSTTDIKRISHNAQEVFNYQDGRLSSIYNNWHFSHDTQNETAKEYFSFGIDKNNRPTIARYIKNHSINNSEDS